MERGNEIMARSNKIMARSNQVMARNEVAFLDLRRFLADQTVALRTLTDELVSEMRAQRQALFRIFDRLDGPAGGAPGTQRS